MHPMKLRRKSKWEKLYNRLTKQRRINRRKRNTKIALAAGIGILGVLKVIAMTGAFMPKISSEYQDLKVKELGKSKSKRVKRILVNAHDGLQLHATVFEAKKPIGLVQIIHGALEHKGRYYPLMQFLADNGYTCIVSDNRGHGFSINNANPLGYMNGVDQIMDDQHRITRYIKKEYKGLPLTILGHSLGAIFARNYLQEYDYEIDKLVLSGTPYFNAFTRVGIYWGRALLFFLGPKRSNRIFNNVSSEKDWLTHNEESIKKAEQDPLMFSKYMNLAGYTIWEANWNLKQYKKYKFQNPGLQILNMAGEEDGRITGGDRGIEDSLDTLEKIGYRKIANIVYPGMKHEVFNENDKEMAYQDLLRFLNQ